MTRRPPRSTRTDTRLPYTTLFRSRVDDYEVHLAAVAPARDVQRKARDAAILHHHIVGVPALRPIERGPLPIVGVKDYDRRPFAGGLHGEGRRDGRFRQIGRAHV